MTASGCSRSSSCTAKKPAPYSTPLRKMPEVFICSHPHTEPSYGRKRKPIGSRVRIPWNTGSYHRRKSISRSGQYLSNGTLVSDTLHFWGEYEPASEADIISTSSPKAVHSKLFPVRGRGTISRDALNTDPYVFGEHFKYICCRMGNKKHIPGDVILFGHFVTDSVAGRLLFELDTVIVIKEVVNIDHKRNTTQYYKASIKPILGKTEYFYKGYNISEKKEYFSFVPCLIQPNLSAIPPKPSLDLTKYGFHVKKGWYSYVAASIPLSQEIWKQLIKDVKKANWQIGTHIDKI